MKSALYGQTSTCRHFKGVSFSLQVVTYKVASRELGVHVNTAKQMLFALSEDNKDLLDVLYLVAGRKADGRSGH